MSNQRAFTLIELTIIILVIGIIATVASRQFAASIDTAQAEQTKAELEQIARAIAGDPASYGMGTQANFGYVGDVGAMPPNLAALAANPGSYTTWNGPYIDASGGTGYATDGWGAAYGLSGVTLSSTGSGSTISRAVAVSTSALTSNTVSGTVLDANLQPPGGTYDDSVTIRIVKPNGSGGTTAVSTAPSPTGSFSLSGIPIGRRTLEIIWLPATDTLRLPLTIYPGRPVELDVVFPADIF